MSNRAKKFVIIFLAVFIVLGMVITSVFGFTDFWQASPATEANQAEEVIRHLEERARELEDLIAQNGDGHHYRELGDLYYHLGYRYFFDMENEEKAVEYWKAALEPYRKALAEDPTDTDIYINLGLAAFNIGDFNTAGENFRRALDGDPDNPLAHLNYGIYALVVEEDRSTALAHLEKARDLAGEETSLQQEIEYWLEEAGRTAEDSEDQGR